MAAASQPEVASQGSQGGPLLLDLAKYSYATLPMNSVGPVPWIHISNTVSLVALFETRRSLGGQGDVQEKSIFKVLKDPEIMEELDLQALARESQLAVERSDDAIQHSKDQNVAVITRAPVIAIKYPLNEREVRRFQIRFQSDEHYYEAMKLFSRAGVRPVEAGTFPSRPRTAVSNNSAAPTAQGQSISSRPATASKLTIKPYVPRPSTVPDTYSQHLSQILPPKRDLPFEKKTDTDRVSQKELRSRKRASAEPAVGADSGRADRDNVQTETQDSPQSTSKRRQPPARASSTRSVASKKARSTRKKVNKPSPKAAPLPKQPDLTVPSIEEHLHEAGIPEAQNSMLEETQALLERAAARLQQRSTRSSSARDNGNVGGQALHRESGTDHDPSNKGPKSALDPTVSGPTAATAPGNAESTALDDTAVAYSQLVQQPEFADSGDKLEGWANGQSTDAQKSAIDKFICDAYQDRKFWNLCRLLEGRVDALMIWPRVLRHPNSDEYSGGNLGA
ncbi:hypothetical protein DV738_g4458, partial [Chaetothyriales sp. CBS 135597]